MVDKRKIVWIATLWKRYILTNYGSFFQHYALQKYLRRLNCIPLRLPDPLEHYGIEYLLRTLIGNLMRSSEETKNLQVSRWRVFQEGVREIVRMWRALRQYHKLIGDERVKIEPSENDVFVSGSDQVWTGIDSRSWGDDVPPRMRRVSYAASADWFACKRNDLWMKKASERLARFSAISIREQEGVNLVNQLIPGHTNIFHAVDPVFLLNREEYNALLPRKRIFNRPTIFCYFVNIHTYAAGLMKRIKELADSHKMDVKVCAIQNAQFYIPQSLQIQVSPCDFLRCIRDADYVITNSFHGTAFCCIYKKDFLVIEQTNLPLQDQNVRQRELLRELELDDHLVDLTTLSELTPVTWSGTKFEGRVSLSKNWLKEKMTNLGGVNA